MRDQVRILVANPAGNKTIFVLDAIPREEYADIAKRLLANEALAGEQVAFITTPFSMCGGRMEMCGQEFCGNATRSYGLMLAKENGISGKAKVCTEVSGVDHPLEVEVNTTTNHTKVQMPLPIETTYLCLDDEPLKLFIFDGIIHGIVINREATLERFNQIKDLILEKFSPLAIGAMFYDAANEFMTPVVWVRDIDATYFEGSCGSGSVALALYLDEEISSGLPRHGTGIYTLIQPEGTLEITVEKDQKGISRVFLAGHVELGEPMTVKI